MSSTETVESTVYTTRRLRGRAEICVHTDRDCNRLSRASNIYQHSPDELAAFRYCKLCSGEAIVSTNDSYERYRVLDGSSPSDLGLSPFGERQQSSEGER